MKYLFTLLIILTACQPATPEEFESEGKAWMQAMTKKLKTIHSMDDLKKNVPFITKKYNQLAKLIKRVKSKQKKHWIINENEESALLKEQLDRIFLLPGAREIFETAQMEALESLDLVK